jgi:hypothetical protein
VVGAFGSVVVELELEVEPLIDGSVDGSVVPEAASLSDELVADSDSLVTVGSVADVS